MLPNSVSINYLGSSAEPLRGIGGVWVSFINLKRGILPSNFVDNIIEREIAAHDPSL